MADLQQIAGQIIRVSARLSGGRQMHVPYIVAEGNPAKAESLIRTIMTADDKVTAVYPLPKSVIDAFGLKRGDFTHFRIMP